MRHPALAALLAAALATPAAAQIQTARPTWASAGYGGAGTTVATGFDPKTRDAAGNRVVINGEIQTAGMTSVQAEFASLSGGAGAASTGAGSSGAATAVGNLLNVQVTGAWNTVVIDARQTNTAAVSAQAGASTPPNTAR